MVLFSLVCFYKPKYNNPVFYLYNVAFLATIEITGLAVGIPALFTTCMEILKRIEAYKEFRVELRYIVA